MAERIAAVGYAAVGKQTTPGVSVIPSIFTPYYKQNMNTLMNVIEDNPVYGNKFKALQALPGQRAHKGTLTVMAEPNSIAQWLDMLLTRTSTTGANPYTHVFGLSPTTDPNSYTLDISTGNQVIRFFGVQASKLSPNWQGDEMQLDVSLSALGSFFGRSIASQSGAGPYTLTLDTTYDPSPTTGLVVGDLIRFIKTDGTGTVDAVVATIPTGTTFTTVTNPSGIVAGDMVLLRPQTVSLNNLTPFLWTKTEYRFSTVDAATALTAAQTRLEQGVGMDIMHLFHSDDGEGRSGSFDPASLVRTRGDYNFKIKRFFDTADDLKAWMNLNKKACVMRAFSGATNQYEFRFTMNNLRLKAETLPSASDDVFYQEQEFASSYDTTDAQGMLATVIDTNPTI